MITHAPPNLLHLTIYITGKRKANERPVLEGFVTDDRRSPAPRDAHEKDDQSRWPSSSTSGSVKTKVQHEAHVVLRSGRPDFEELVEREVQATEYSEWLAIGACGPAPMKSVPPSPSGSLRRTTNADLFLLVSRLFRSASLADAVSLAVRPAQVLRGEVRRAITLEIEEFGW